jgi:hypothetical protein
MSSYWGGCRLCGCSTVTAAVCARVVVGGTFLCVSVDGVLQLHTFTTNSDRLWCFPTRAAAVCI